MDEQDDKIIDKLITCMKNVVWRMLSSFQDKT